MELSHPGCVGVLSAFGADGTIYVGSYDHNLYAFNPKDGSLKWRFTTGNVIWSSPAVALDGTIYVGSYDGNLYALTDNGTSCLQKWHFATSGAIKSSPVIHPDGAIFVGSGDKNLYAINPDGSQLLKYCHERPDLLLPGPQARMGRRSTSDQMTATFMRSICSRSRYMIMLREIASNLPGDRCGRHHLHRV